MGTFNFVIQPMQVQNSAARLILKAPRHRHCTPLLQQLHWLPISERVKYKIACKCYSSISLNYCGCTALPDLSTLHQTHAYSNIRRFNLHGFHSFTFSGLTSGTTSPKTSDSLLLSLPSRTNSRHFSSLSISTE